MGMGNRLAGLIAQRGMRPAALAREAGVSKNTIYSMIRRDNDKADAATLAKLAKALGVPVSASDFSSYTVAGAQIDCDFALRCEGDSMIDARIYDGDVVFIRQQDYVDDGTIAAVLIDDEATLKRVYHLSDGRVELRAANARYAPIILGGENETRSLRILGKAVSFQSNVI